MPTVQRSRRANALANAPVWRTYLDVRKDPKVGTENTTKPLVNARIRKRPKPVASATGELSTGETLARIRAYWEHLTASERLQILFVDDPELVKQLYKLNWSLLCVGLMQRHLKSPKRAQGVSGGAGNVPKVPASESASVDDTEQQKSTNEAATDAVAASDSSADEKTYELLEAMEFMDIGTGILTVKSELVEDPNRLFELVGAVFPGFLSTIHQLSETQFQDLFIKESEVISSWEGYECLIAMLVEQLILRSYVVYREKEAAAQMERLLLEVSLEDTLPSAREAGKKSKKKKKKKKTAKASVETVKEESRVAVKTTASEEADTATESEPEQETDVEMEEPKSDLTPVDTRFEPTEVIPPSSSALSTSRLNPLAQVYQPPTPSSAFDDLRSPSSGGKRKLDEYIIHVPWEDVQGDDDIDMEPRHRDDVELGCRRPREKFRRRDEEAELEWHLQHMYASVSEMFGWDFSRQREIGVHRGPGSWNEAALWRTQPQDVVRYYFSSTTGAARTPHVSAYPAALPSSPFMLPPPHPHAPNALFSGGSSRYYFTPPHHEASTLPPPGYPPYLPLHPPVSFWDEPSSINSTAPSTVVAAAEFPLQAYATGNRPNPRTAKQPKQPAGPTPAEHIQ
ncbi:hypothetical protein Poli38472_006602 [Pythium oligandrum]|uniref:Uncharacterized protein n=1 Tax=Pythium oligandrum TaxID=41045 RepID=A0A8K1C5T3_PYTOL|nr:hypothetical protein Poli38472_006602 [Pythium oligandrum]|eukprot:TMW56592.1 hypothetical protein Poli38472_006602 [Pythium oligandrum]